jgi:hypothetical protein
VNEVPDGMALYDRARSPFLDLSLPEPTLADPVVQLCTEAQFREPDYARWCEAIGEAPRLHRKQWEFVYILQVLERHGMLAPGRRGLGFGCGHEPLAAAMAARRLHDRRDRPRPERPGEPRMDQDRAACRGARRPQRPRPVRSGGVPRAREPPQRRHERDPDDLRGFDFVWSSCAFEHLGSIAHGLRFVRNAMACLAPGGLAVHTTEFNLTSNLSTLESPMLSVYRRYDIDGLAERLAREGHRVPRRNLNPGTGQVDRYVDLPPYNSMPHLRLMLDRYATTSIGLYAARGG